MSVPPPEWPCSTFWQFSLDAYARPAVERACLALQDELGFDVNLVLLAAWATASGRRLDAGLAASLRQFGDTFQAAIVRPLRQARRALKATRLEPTLTPLLTERRRVLSAVELDLEHLEQLQLQAMLAAAAPAAVPLADALPADPAAAAAACLEANLRALYPDRPLPPAALAALSAALLAIRDSASSSISGGKTTA